MKKLKKNYYTNNIPAIVNQPKSTATFKNAKNNKNFQDDYYEDEKVEEDGPQTYQDNRISIQSNQNLNSKVMLNKQFSQ